MGLLRMGYKCIAKWRLIYNKPNKIEPLGNLEIMAKTLPKHNPSSFLGLLRPNMEFPVRFFEPCPYLASWTSSQSRIKVFKKKRCLHEDRTKYLNTWWTSEYIAGQFHDGFCKQSFKGTGQSHSKPMNLPFGGWFFELRITSWKRW